MSRFLTTIPSNSGFYNLGTVEAYPTGGTGPTAYGPTSYFGSSPLAEESGDGLYNPIDLGSVTDVFKTVTIKNSHGGLSRRQTTFYTFKLEKSRSVQFTQNYSQFSYEKNTNKNTLLAFYKIYEKNRREELPINDSGFVYKYSSINQEDEESVYADYPSIALEPGKYLFLITNDIKYLETIYSISLNINLLNWGSVDETKSETINFANVNEGIRSSIDFGTLVN